MAPALDAVEPPIEIGRSFGKFGPIPADDVDYCYGPEFLNEAPRAYRRFTFRWVFWQAADGVRLQRLSEFTGDETAGGLTGLFDGEIFPWVSGNFDGVGTPVVAVEDAGTVRLRKFESNVPVEFSFPGHCPLIFNSGQVYFRTSEKELWVYYLTPDRTQVRVRKQSDNFSSESVVAGLPYPLAKLTKVDNKRLWVWLWGLTVPAVPTQRDTVRQAVLQSEEFEPYPEIVEEYAVGRAGLVSGIYSSNLEIVGIDDFAAAAVALTAGNYFEIIVPSSADEFGSAGATLHSGDYAQVIKPTSGASFASAGAGVLGGTYTELLKPTGGVSGFSSAEVGLQSGVYEAV